MPATPHLLLLHQAMTSLIFCFFFFSLFMNSALSSRVPTFYNVISFGANPNGRTDSTRAFLHAWSVACRSRQQAAIYVPLGVYRLGNARFRGPCRNRAISMFIDGMLIAPSDYRSIAAGEKWLLFEHVNGVAIHGGVLNGRGSSLWRCKRSGRSCPAGATTLAFSNSKNIHIYRLTSYNSQMFHITFNGCHKVRMKDMVVVAPGNSPNTDGIHVQLSTDVSIMNSRISTGDDCISIGPGTSNLKVENVTCGPGHGVSIGSLGRELKESGVHNVTVKRVRFFGTQNGVRIKSWARPSNGFVRNIIFRDIVMTNVHNPIIIDQHYCPDNKNCPHQASGVKIGDVTYKDIRGTSATQVAVKFDCSPRHPCKKIRLEDVNLTYKHHEARALCNHARGTATASVQPESCL